MKPSVPGLHILRGFLSVSECRTALSEALRLSDEASRLAQSLPGYGVTSAAHNVNSRERFKSLLLPLGDGRTASCEHFDNYAEGHKLTYFRGEIPQHGLPSLIDMLGALPPVRAELVRSREQLGRSTSDVDKWKLTLNRYPADALLVRVGFPWHRDLTTNGAATMILNLGAAGSLEFGVEPPSSGKEEGLRYSSDHGVAPEDSVSAVERLTLTDGDLLLLTGPARWEYLHRVVPSRGADERVSLVYGVW
mmetsp:Transcript_30446/g.50418  ORF Transcript_30446/g.50418 Transcript_30446/m.50418 type:complete len:249 (-) Transcript_30446:193-939(-)|eukprot:CAMPEP_0119331654 /NCGR_PEP_ID=MMETSP1333-20130426/81030_1 /TAXON_ID=418940 /ORGANISM="Scyphosphaera apsteinii, Strain RCC1455" /LENGTH=248 /DNA_ID=CAMNT_0007341307 /DNA_START=254 /DNA_END=997 /DNA_ORIENTATION=-